MLVRNLREKLLLILKVYSSEIVGVTSMKHGISLYCAKDFEDAVSVEIYQESSINREKAGSRFTD